MEDTPETVATEDTIVLDTPRNVTYELLGKNGPPSDQDLAKLHLILELSQYLKVSLKSAAQAVQDIEEFYSQ